MQKKLAVYCCGGVGREIALYYKSQNKYDEVIFIDDNPPAQEMNSIHIYTYDEFVNLGLELFDVVVTSGEPSIEYKDEELLLKETEKSDSQYIEKILPEKMTINLLSLRRLSFFSDIYILVKTLFIVI